MEACTEAQKQRHMQRGLLSGVCAGDMGVEIGLEQMPLVQKMLTAKCVEAGKICINATQAHTPCCPTVPLVVRHHSLLFRYTAPCPTVPLPARVAFTRCIHTVTVLSF